MKTAYLERYFRALAIGLCPSVIFWLSATTPLSSARSFDFSRFDEGLRLFADQGYTSISATGNFEIKPHALAGSRIPIPNEWLTEPGLRFDVMAEHPTEPGRNAGRRPDIPSDEPASTDTARPAPPTLIDVQ